ncbi:MAG TPA: murein biosynthesis integral membrane protein MurJ [Candidatus Binatia bacterium]|jgi:putative peptidoglycan lipid II flippase
MEPLKAEAPTAPVEGSRSSVARNAGIVSVAVMASRILGLVRDQVFAALFGAGFQYDAFLTAFRIPNLLRDLFAEGALSAAFVTTFAQVLEKRGEKEAFRLSNVAATAMILVVIVICIIGWIFAREIVYWLAPGFFEIPGKADLTIHLTRIMIPFLLFIAMAAKAMGILNARQRFGIPAIAAAFFNIGSILGGLFFGYVIGPSLNLIPIEGMAMGTLLGGFLQFAVQWPSLRRAGFRYRPMLNFSDPGLRQIFRLMGPAVIGTAAVQVNVFVNTNFASAIIDPSTGAVANGPVSWLSYAFRFMQFPIGVFGVAIATASLPPLSRSTARQDYDEFRRTLSHALALVFLLCIPSAVGLAVLGRPIVALIFQHGKFTAVDTMQTGNALAAYALGLAGYGAVKVLSPAFYALGDARVPMMISLFSIAVNYLMNSLLVARFGHVGLAFSTSTVALVNFFLLLIFMRRKLETLEGRELARSLLKVCAATVPMALVAWCVSAALSGGSAPGLMIRLVNVTAAILAAALVFYWSCRVLKIPELDEAINGIGGRFLRLLRPR